MMTGKAAKTISCTLIMGSLALCIMSETGGAAAKTAATACNSDAKAVELAVSEFRLDNPSLIPTPANLAEKTNGGPFLEKWPSNGTHYAVSLNATGAVMISVPAGARAVSYDTANPCASAS